MARHDDENMDAFLLDTDDFQEAGTARQEGVKGVGLKYVGTRKIVAVVRRPTKFSLTTKYRRRLMEWKGKVSGDSHEVLEHLLTMMCERYIHSAPKETPKQPTGHIN